jgi:hypothetical protein
VGILSTSCVLSNLFNQETEIVQCADKKLNYQGNSKEKEDK